MKINDIAINESTTSGAIATVSAPMTTQSRNASIYGGKKVGNLLTGKKTNKKYANSVNESKMKQVAMDLETMQDGNFKQKYGKTKEQMMQLLGVPTALQPKNKLELNESVPLKFHTVTLTKDQLSSYSIKFFEAYNIDKHNQNFKLLLHKLHNNHPIVEAVENSDIAHFIQTIDRLNSKKEIKAGDMFSVLSFTINPALQEVDVVGFTTPKKVKEIKLRSDGSINSLIFTDGDRYPRIPVAAVGKHHAEHPAYFSNSTDAKHALTQLKLMLPETWDMDTSAVNDPNYRSGLKESSMKIEELSEDDLILVPGKGHRLKTGFHAFDPDKAEHEGETLKNSLRTIARNAKELHSRLENSEQFPEWVSEKIGAIKGMMTAVTEYLISSQEPAESAGVIAGGGVGESAGGSNGVEVWGNRHGFYVTTSNGYTINVGKYLSDEQEDDEEPSTWEAFPLSSPRELEAIKQFRERHMKKTSLNAIPAEIKGKVLELVKTYSKLTPPTSTKETPPKVSPKQEYNVYAASSLNGTGSRYIVAKNADEAKKISLLFNPDKNVNIRELKNVSSSDMQELQKVQQQEIDQLRRSDKVPANEGKKPGLWANIHAKRERIKHGSGERMRKPGSKGAPSAQDFKDAAKEGVGEKIKGAIRREKAKDLPVLQTRRDYAMGKAGDAYNKGEIRKGNQYSAYAEKDRKKKGDPTTNPAGTYRTKTSDYTNENAWNQLGQRKPNTNLPAPDRGSRVNHGRHFEEGDIVLPLSGPLKGQPHKVIHSQRTSIRIVPLGRDSYPGDTIAPRTKHEWVVPAEVNEAQSLGGALKNSLAKAEPGSKLDNSIKNHNRDVKNGGKGTLKNAPTGYHFDSKGYCRLGDK